MNNHKLRASFTLLQKWADGNWQEAVEMYFRLNNMTTRAMAEGKDYHEKWAAETKITSCLPSVFGGEKLVAPRVEHEIVVPMEDWLDLKVIIDCLDEPTIHEYKRTASSPDVYARSKQGGIYAIGCAMAGIYVNKAVYHTFDPSTGMVGTASVWLTDSMIDETQEWITTYSSEIYAYFIENKLFEQFGGRRENS